MFNTSAFWTGFFTLLATLTAIWQKDYLDRKKEYKSTIKQKAIEAYVLANRLNTANVAKSIICSNLLQDANYNYEFIQKNYPDTVFEDLQKLELLIVEHFFDLNADFLKLNAIIVDETSLLLGIISNPKNNAIKQEEFTQNRKNYQQDVIKSSLNLRKKLTDQYINVSYSQINIHEIFSSVKIKIKNFLKNPKSD